MEDFYYTLQSNASLKMYPGNKACRFSVQLPAHMNLDDSWVVGMSEVHFPLSFTDKFILGGMKRKRSAESGDGDSDLPDVKRCKCSVQESSKLETIIALSSRKRKL